MNYREVGLEVINGQQARPFNARWKVWQPNLGLGSMMKFGHLQCSCLHFPPMQYGECNFYEDDKHGIVLVLQHIVGL